MCARKRILGEWFRFTTKGIYFRDMGGMKQKLYSENTYNTMQSSMLSTEQNVFYRDFHDDITVMAKIQKLCTTSAHISMNWLDCNIVKTKLLFCCNWLFHSVVKSIQLFTNGLIFLMMHVRNIKPSRQVLLHSTLVHFIRCSLQKILHTHAMHTYLTERMRTNRAEGPWKWERRSISFLPTKQNLS